ncbi:MAG: penicillin acylase family protein [Planctomycetota bacterium]
MTEKPSQHERDFAKPTRRRLGQWRRRVLVGIMGLLSVLGISGAMVSCVATPPKQGSIDGLARLDALDRDWPGLGRPVEISFDEHLIPSITAQSDADAAYTIGLVHAHLRLSQMELLRRVSQGRLAEMGGPLAAGIDEAIRAIDLDRAVAQMEQDLPVETRTWITKYVEGVNDYKQSIRRRPADAFTLGFSYNDPWTAADVLTFARLASVDINWGRWLSVFAYEGQLGHEDFVERLWAFADRGVPSFGPEVSHELSVLTDIGRTGSNAFVVSGERSVSGGALVASDPHLGLPQPNIWCVLGYRTPDRAAVGLMIPTLPFVLVGRSEQVAWTGTNMQSSSSVLYQLPEGWDTTMTREESIAVRFWFDRKARVRESAFGPVISDAGLLKRIGEGEYAMRWRGHFPSDESSAFFRASTAGDFESFREAFATYAAGGQNILYGDASGNIGQIMAIEAVPAAAASSRIGAVSPRDERFAWGPGIPSNELPASYNPEAGFLVSANNVPVRMTPPLVPQGNSNDRVVRMQELLSEDKTYTLDDLAEIQRDTYSGASFEVAQRLASRDVEYPEGGLKAAIALWDGRYDRDSVGAAAYQIVLSELIDLLYTDRYSESIVGMIREGSYVHRFVAEDLQLDGGAVIDQAFHAASEVWEPGTTWGDFHRLRLEHPIGYIPLLGRAYRFGDLPYDGSSSTIFKGAHRVSGRQHSTDFGANSRLLCDMGTLDDNRVVLLGGQDGWLGSDRLLDQVPLWQAGQTIPLPLSAEGQSARAERTLLLGRLDESSN